jgi:hypothetical protein
MGWIGGEMCYQPDGCKDDRWDNRENGRWDGRCLIGFYGRGASMHMK